MALWWSSGPGGQQDPPPAAVHSLNPASPSQAALSRGRVKEEDDSEDTLCPHSQ